MLKKSGKIFTSKCCVKAHFHAFQCGTQIIGLFLNVCRHGKLIYMIDYVRRKHSGGFLLESERKDDLDLVLPAGSDCGFFAWL